MDRKFFVVVALVEAENISQALSAAQAIDARVGGVTARGFKTEKQARRVQNMLYHQMAQLRLENGKMERRTRIESE